MSIRTTSGRSRTDQLHRGPSVGGLADDLDVVGGSQQDGETSTYQGLVVGDRDTDHVERMRSSQRRELELQAVAEQLEQLERLGEVADPESSEPAQRQVRRQLRRRRRHDHLTAMTARRDPRRLVHGQGDVVTGHGRHRLTGVHAHSHANGRIRRPTLDSETLLRSQACGERSVDVGEHDEAPVALRVHLDTAPRPPRVTQDLAVTLDRRREQRFAETGAERRRSFDVGEAERHLTAWQLRHRTSLAPHDNRRRPPHAGQHDQRQRLPTEDPAVLARACVTQWLSSGTARVHPATGRPAGAALESPGSAGVVVMQNGGVRRTHLWMPGNGPTLATMCDTRRCPSRDAGRRRS